MNLDAAPVVLGCAEAPIPDTGMPPLMPAPAGMSGASAVPMQLDRNSLPQQLHNMAQPFMSPNGVMTADPMGAEHGAAVLDGFRRNMRNPGAPA